MWPEQSESGRNEVSEAATGWGGLDSFGGCRRTLLWGCRKALRAGGDVLRQQELRDGPGSAGSLQGGGGILVFPAPVESFLWPPLQRPEVG